MEVTIELAVIKALSRFVNPNDWSRPQLHGIALDKRGYAVATDGNIMGVARLNAAVAENCILPLFFVSDLIKLKTRAATVDLIIAGGSAVCTSEPAAPCALDTTLTFVQWERAYPREVSGEHAFYDVRLLKRIADANADLGAPKGCAGMLPLNMNGQGAGVIPLRESFHAVVMPLRPTALQAGYTPFAL